MALKGKVGPRKNADGADSEFRLGSFGELVTSDMNGFFFEQTQKGDGDKGAVPIQTRGTAGLLDSEGLGPAAPSREPDAGQPEAKPGRARR